MDAVQIVAQDLGGGHKEIDIKNYAKIEKIPGGTIEDCKVLAGETHTHRCRHTTPRQYVQCT